MTRQSFLIRVPGHGSYIKSFDSSEAARIDAQRKYPFAWPASVTNLTQKAAQRRAAKC